MRNRDVFHTALHARRAGSGFTLVELMVTVAVVAILMAVGAPQLRGFLLKQQAAADVDAFTTAVRLARSEALKRSGTVTVCALPSNFDPATPACAASTSTDWSSGWMVFIDYGTLGSYEAGDTKIRVEQRTRPATITYGHASISYRANGLIQASDLGSLFVSPANATNPTDDTQCKCVAISIQGQLRNGVCKAVTGGNKCI